LYYSFRKKVPDHYKSFHSLPAPFQSFIEWWVNGAGGGKLSKVQKKAPRARARASAKKERLEVKVERELPPRGAAPSAIVRARHNRERTERRARGFSMREISVAGLSFERAKNWRVSLDIRRRSLLDGNVTRLRSWLQTRRPAKIEKPTEPMGPKEEKPTKRRKKAATKEPSKKKEKPV